MAIHSLQTSMQLRQCFARAKPFPLEKSQMLSMIFEKRHHFKIWLQKSQLSNPAEPQVAESPVATTNQFMDVPDVVKKCNKMHRLN